MRQSISLRVSLLFVSSVALALWWMPGNGYAQGRSGEEVVKEVCAACHGTGANGAPRIGDVEAWRHRTSQGLTALTRHALEGIRKMPAHGGQPDLSDLEIARAITYMVNASGGHWVAPTTASDLMSERTGKQVVEAVCVECHKEGKGGAPRIGDKATWTLRLQQGLSYAVHSAIRGHGGMPPRGGTADLTDNEIRNAILYMFNPAGSAAAGTSAGAARQVTVAAGSDHASVGGMDIYLGVISAKKLRSYPAGSAERNMHGGVPEGDDWYHVNVSLLDHRDQTPVTGADVDAQVEDVGVSSRSKKLDPMTIGQGSYGNYFRLRPRTSYRVTVSVRTPESSGPVEARFSYEHP